MTTTSRLDVDGSAKQTPRSRKVVGGEDHRVDVADSEQIRTIIEQIRTIEFRANTDDQRRRFGANTDDYGNEQMSCGGVCRGGYTMERRLHDGDGTTAAHNLAPLGALSAQILT